jgi:hypothetical protein
VGTVRSTKARNVKKIAPWCIDTYFIFLFVPAQKEKAQAPLLVHKETSAFLFGSA